MKTTLLLPGIIFMNGITHAENIVGTGTVTAIYESKYDTGSIHITGEAAKVIYDQYKKWNLQTQICDKLEWIWSRTGFRCVKHIDVYQCWANIEQGSGSISEGAPNCLL